MAVADSATAPLKNVHFKDHNEIVLSDGTKLSATTWMPDDAEQEPVPAILEYLPYRKKDQTAKRDALNHPYFAAHGYACVRVDMRGTGDSQGLLLGEYLQQEQDDALEVLDWIAAQPWCTGAVGMIGISWGGFNGLQVAALRPPQLKAVISICSTDDRYNGDIHYMGGCLLVENFLWGASMFAITPTPPDPNVVGSVWREMWLQRLESGATYVAEWHERQRRDEFWNHASVDQDYAAVEAPVYLIGGWADPYHPSIFRMLKNLRCDRKAMVGPWGHLYPNFGQPGPQIGFLQESIRWWNRWLKGKQNDIMEEPMLRCYMQDSVAPQRHYNYRPGRWVSENKWPSPDLEPARLFLSPGSLSVTKASRNEHVSICSPQDVGFAAGKWLVFGPGQEGPADQRRDGDGSLVFDTENLTDSVDILGAPILKLNVSSDQKNALVAATLSEVLTSGAVTRLSYGLLNLTHRGSDNKPEFLEPGKAYNVTVRLNELGQRISSGSRLRLAISTTYFPMVWPSPEPATITIDCANSELHLSMRPAQGDDPKDSPFEPPQNGPSLPTKTLREAKTHNTLSTDLDTGVVTIRYDNDEGAYLNLNTRWCYGVHEIVSCSIHPEEPLSARVEQTFKKEYGLEKPNLCITGWLRMAASREHWHISAHIDAWEDGGKIFGRDYGWKIERDHV